jgi:two-component system, OmpR family, phosphate regulon sensor histidine kinase PhoR
MPQKRIWINAVILFILAGSILTTQVTWIIKSARIEESFLNQKINMALCSSMDVLSKDKGICSGLESCSSLAPGSFELTLTKQKKQKIDSVISQHLLFYNIQVPFQTIFSPYNSEESNSSLASNQALLYPVAHAGMQNTLVELEIPSKYDLIRAQINGTFILSIVMLILLITIFINTLRGLVKESNIRKETVDVVNTMAHDLKTPISNISFALSLFTRENPALKPSNNQYLSIIEKETNKLKQRARQILGVASIDAVLEDKADRAQININELIHNSVESFSLQCREAKAKISVQLDANQPTIVGSEVQLSSAVTNIIDNAICYSPGSPLVQIRTENKENSVNIEIEDNGPGIPLQEQELIFKKGYRGLGSKTRTEGFGFGLYLAKTLVEKQGGKLSLFSDGSNGSRFTIQLPVS